MCDCIIHKAAIDFLSPFRYRVPVTINLKQIQIDPVKLKAAREQRLISQVLAAKAVGISQARLWNYENGEARIPGYLLARLCLLYGVQVTDLTNAGEIFLQNGSIAA